MAQIDLTAYQKLRDDELEHGNFLIHQISKKVQSFEINNRKEPQVIIIDNQSYYFIRNYLTYSYDNLIIRTSDGFESIFGIRLLICNKLVEGELLIY